MTSRIIRDCDNKITKTLEQRFKDLRNEENITMSIKKYLIFDIIRYKIRKMADDIIKSDDKKSSAEEENSISIKREELVSLVQNYAFLYYETKNRDILNILYKLLYYFTSSDDHIIVIIDIIKDLCD